VSSKNEYVFNVQGAIVEIGHQQTSLSGERFGLGQPWDAISLSGFSFRLDGHLDSLSTDQIPAGIWSPTTTSR
jgi:hypothetical protein